MTARLAAIGRFPVKSIGGETLERVTLTAGETLPGDRAFGVLHEGARRYLEDDELRVWLPKAAFLRGAASAPLQAIRGGWTAAGKLRLTHPDRPGEQQPRRLAGLLVRLGGDREGDPHSTSTRSPTAISPPSTTST